MGHPQLKSSTGSSPELEKLVRAAQRGDETATAALITATKDRLYRFLLYLSGDAQIAGDILQDTYVYALEHLASVKEPAAFVRWLFVVAKSRFIDYRRSPRNKPHDAVETLDAHGVIENDHGELTAQTHEALGKLDADDRALLLLVDLEEHSYAETAEILGISEAAVRSRLHRARQAFHEAYFQDETNSGAKSPSKRGKSR